jgi:hypothetical protein
MVCRHIHTHPLIDSANVFTSSSPPVSVEYRRPHWIRKCAPDSAIVIPWDLGHSSGIRDGTGGEGDEGGGGGEGGGCEVGVDKVVVEEVVGGCEGMRDGIVKRVIEVVVVEVFGGVSR